MALLPQGQLGYRIDLENVDYLEAVGQPSMELLAKYRDSFPQFNIDANPADLVRIRNQQSLGSCQGHAAAMVMSICVFLATGRWIEFSPAAAYYLSQRRDNIRGDNGSTLSGGNWVLTQHGLCLESDWPYVNRYDPTQPPGIQFPYKLAASKPLRTIDEWVAWNEAGLPIQGGLAWNDYCNRELVNDWRPGGGGHSTTWWLRRSNGNRPNINSWGQNWNRDGIHEWTLDAIEKALRHQWTVFIGYAPDNLTMPNPEPIA